MKIGIAIGTMQGGGAQRVVSVLSEYLATRGYEVTIITTSDNILDYEISSKVKMLSLLAKNRLIFVKQTEILFKLFANIKREKYNVILAFLPMTCIYVAMCKVLGCEFKLISSERMDPYQDPHSKLLRYIRNWAYKKSDGIVLQTEDAMDYFSSKIQRKSKIIYNPINANIPPAEYEKREKRIVTAVRLEKQKNVEMLIDAFAIFHADFPEYTLEIYGQGKLEPVIRKRIESYGLKDSIFLLGFKNNIYDYLQHASFFVLSSDYEGVSNAMLESLCMGIPVVSTDHPIGGARMFVENSINGFLSPVGDAVKFADAMEKMAGLTHQQYREMCENAASVRDDLEPLNVCSQWEEFILTC